METNNILECGRLKIPVECITNLVTTRTANKAQTAINNFRLIGYAPQEVQIGFAINASVCGLFGFDNIKNAITELDSICTPSRVRNDRTHNALYICGKRLAPYIEFTITSCTKSLQADKLGTLQEIDYNLVLSGCFATKAVAHNEGLSIAKDDDLNINISIGGKVLKIGDEIGVNECRLRPFGATLTLVIRDSFTKFSEDALRIGPAISPDCIVNLNGINYYIANSTNDGSIISFELSTIPREYEKQKDKTFYKTSIKDILKDIADGATIANGDNLEINNYLLRGSATDFLRAIQDELGFFVCDNNGLPVVYAPKEIKADGDLNYYTDFNIISHPIASIAINDNAHFVELGTGKDRINIQTAFVHKDESGLIKTAQRISDFLSIMRNEFHLEIPYDKRIRHHSQVAIINNNKKYNCIVTNYDADLLSGTMDLTLNFKEG